MLSVSDLRCEEHDNSTLANFRLILLTACAKIEVVTLLLLLCVINKRRCIMEGEESISKLKGKLNKQGRGQGTGTGLVWCRQYYKLPLNEGYLTGLTARQERAASRKSKG